MTSISPRHVWYEYEMELFGNAGYTPVEVESVILSADMDRVPFCASTVGLKKVTDAAWAELDSRRATPTRLHFRVHQKAYDASGAVVTVATLPRIGDGTGNQVGELVVRRASRDWITRRVTVELRGREALVDDKRRIAESANNTGATSVYELVEWSLLDVFGSFSFIADSIVSGTAIPSGDRRWMLPGETHNDLLEPELSAIGCRLYDLWGRTWYAVSRDTPPTYAGAPTLVKLAAYETDENDTLPGSDIDPIVTAVTEDVDRDSDWADGVLVKGSYVNNSGTRVEWAQASGAGVNTRGRVIEVERAEPAANLADEFVTRTAIRGHQIEVTARCRFDVLPGMDISVYLRDSVVLQGSIRAVEWNLTEGTMTIRVQTGDPL